MERAVLIYDGDCRFCQGSIDWVRRREIPGEFEFLTCQSPERVERFPEIEESTCIEAMQLVLPDGRILAGDRAVPEILKRMRGWRWLAALFRIPGLGLVSGPLYAWVARNRYAISCAIFRRGGDRAGPNEPSGEGESTPRETPGASSRTGRECT